MASIGKCSKCEQFGSFYNSKYKYLCNTHRNEVKAKIILKEMDKQYKEVIGF